MTHQYNQSGRRRPRLSEEALFRLLILWFCVAPSITRAATQAEDDMDKAPMPHEVLGSHSTPVKVHLASSHGYLIGRPDDAARLAMLRTEVAECVRRNSAAGVTSRPPRAWPDHVDSQRSDVYSAINRTIRYSSTLAYGANQLDCSLIEVRNSTASLYSSQGICDIDLRAKTARGACDTTGHASAKPPTRRPKLTAAQIAAIERDAATNPATAALAAAVRTHPPVGTGEHKIIVGLECEVRKNPLDLEGTICLSLGGSFVPANVPGEMKLSGLELEATSIAGIKMLATKAELDALVDSSVFTPYLTGDFRITNTGVRP